MSALSAMSLLLCCAVVALWVRCRTGDDVFSRVFLGKRYTFISSGGTLAFYVPPPPARNPEARQAAADIVGELANSQVKWVGWLAHEKPAIDEVDYPEPYYHSAAERAFNDFAQADLINPLLAALEDSRRLTVVHLLLQTPRLPRFWGPRMYPVPIDGPPLGRCSYQPEGYPPLDRVTGSEVNFAGLTVKLNRWPNASVGGNITSLGECTIEMAGEPDATQLPQIREQWHRKLDVPLMVVRDWQAAAVLSALPLTTIGFTLRRRKQRRTRRQEGLCPACGYDVRAWDDRCPECGIAITSISKASTDALLTSSSTAQPSSS